MATSASTTILPLLLSLLLYFPLAAFAATTPPFTPTDYILLDCGSASNSTSPDTRQWHADTLSSSLTNTQTSQPTEQSPSIPQTPYMSARIFLSKFTYTFPSLSPGPKLLRLYFYPATYNQNLNKTTSFFSLTANQNTLLSNFSAFLTVSSATPSSPTLIKEYIIHINDTFQELNLTFLPNPGSYAFINGIELVSIPNDLYFQGNNVPLTTDTSNPFYLKNGTALETLYRLNVGGGFVPVTGDTGMFRSWIPDDDYILAYATGIPTSRSVDVNYSSSTPAYTAPEIVYTSARIMNENFSLSYNMTWVFHVDSGFYYLLRLHFCEFFLEIREPGRRVFTIFINNRTVVKDADVISWANGPQKAVFKDYVAVVGDPDGRKSKQDLWLSMKPVTDVFTVYDNAILNGLEIFKISQPNGSLDSPNPDLPPVSSTPSGQPANSGNKKSKSSGVIGGVAGGVAFVVVVGVAAFLIFRRRRWVKKSDENKEKSWDLPSEKSKSTKTSTTSGGGSLLPADLCKHFSLDEIIKTTGNFDDNFMIGVGGFGNVYKGFVDNGGTEVAIKRLSQSSNQGKVEFFTEIEMLSKLRHLHVVSLIGYCDENGEMILVYDYMSRGTLRDHLYNSLNPPLTWKQRLQICIGAAKGLHYLHTSANYSIIHRDVKSTNILLDEKWVAKVSDFGLSKVGPVGTDTHVSTLVKGSFGYVDPEYYKRHQLTEKSDVYSFGVVLFEVLCSRPPIVQGVPKDQINLSSWVRLCNKNEKLSKVIDAKVKGEAVVESLNKFVEIGLSCLKDKGSERPAMSDVVWSLEFALQLQEAAEKSMKSTNEEDSPSSRLGLHFEAPTTDDDNNDMFSMSMGTSSASYSKSKSSGDFSASGDAFKSQSVFSEIMQPSAR